MEEDIENTEEMDAEEAKEAMIRAWEADCHARAEENGGLIPAEVDPHRYQLRREPRLPMPGTAPAVPRDVANGTQTGEAPPDQTERLLNGMIAECHQFMRDIAFQTARLTPVADERINFINAACRLADTGGKLAESVGRLRGAGTAAAEDHRHMTFEHVHISRTPDPVKKGKG